MTPNAMRVTAILLLAPALGFAPRSAALLLAPSRSVARPARRPSSAPRLSEGHRLRAAADDEEVESYAAILEAAAALRAEAAAMELEIANDAAAAQAAGLDKFFALADANGDGVVSLTELTTALQKLLVDNVDDARAAKRNALFLENRLIEQVFATLDANDDGVLQRSELQPVETIRRRLEGIWAAERALRTTSAAAENTEAGFKQLTQERLDAFESAANLTTGPARIAACLAYTLPALDAAPFSFVQNGVPPLDGFAPAADAVATGGVDAFAPFVDVARQIVEVYHAVPFSGLIVFLGLSSLAGNAGAPRLARFAARHAIILDVAAAVVLPILDTQAPGPYVGAARPIFIGIVALCAVSSALGVRANFLPLSGTLTTKLTNDYESAITRMIVAQTPGAEQPGADDPKDDKDDSEKK
ncbi:hypothetical protein M885DRAFT_542495 [Pelagophyceae sp. CCMP2097]|nr:hypothetical protein M885DRAFT_542495 [Pelagophyceae sp. CCMP2097]|mmetsp:Transcript_28118/g.97259  ORF Transcript_28118/g.97259 Transcript_28118/m.97259 type:complete len:417 (+) Transcript_28118:104-1354(+)